MKKDITFIYMDTAEYQNYYPIYEEAKRRGYQVKMTKRRDEKCEIGVYCQHWNYPFNSKFSVIMLHDIIQGYGFWPDLWKREPWFYYDIGILPGKQWSNNWIECSKYEYARPRLGVYEVGWPKADVIRSSNLKNEKKKLQAKYGLDVNKQTVLYAPAWENDGKQDEFVKAMLPLGVNIVIKQYPASKEHFPKEYKAISEMAELHKGIKGVHVLDPKTNIMEAIAMSDVLVSEESSTMCEATIMGMPAVSVVDWMIPDVSPSRLPVCNHPFTIKTQKADLTKCVTSVLENYEEYCAISKEYCEKNFSNIGKTAEIFMDIIDAIVEGKSIPYQSLEGSNDLISMTKEECKQYKKALMHSFWHDKYIVNHGLTRAIYQAYKKIKRIIIK